MIKERKWQWLVATLALGIVFYLLAPVLTTALASALALAPFVVRGEVAGYELAHSLAVVMIGGLVTSTPLTLFVVPVVYLGFGASAVAETEPSAVTDELMADLAPHADSPAPAGVAMQPNVQPEPST